MATRSKAAQSGEAKILLLSAQTQLSQTSGNELVELLQTDIVINRLLQLAEDHGIYAVLHQHLNFLIHPALLAGDFFVDNFINPVEAKPSGASGHAH